MLIYLDFPEVIQHHWGEIGLFFLYCDVSNRFSGVDAVKGPCAVFIFSALCVLLVIVIVNRVGGGGWGEGGMLTIIATARGRMSVQRVCLYHVGQEHDTRAAALCGEIIATMCWEFIYFQVDVITGDGNKAAYLPTPKTPGCPTYEVSLVQFWIDCMINTATQSRIKHFGRSPPLRAKHFISCSYLDLAHLNHHLRGIGTNTLEELARKTAGHGGCCMMTLWEWGHAKDGLNENINDFD